MSRLFAFGCSYTAYAWPTWADLLSMSFGKYQNWAVSGIGNRAILERLNECHIKHNFTKDDTIVIQWSTHLRNDFFHQTGSLTDRIPGWKTAGSIFNYINNQIYDSNWYSTFFDEEAYLMHCLNYISIAQVFLKSIGCKWYMTSIGDIRNIGLDLNYDNSNNYGEDSILSKVVNCFRKYNNDTEYPLYKISPGLKIYNKSIWEDNYNHWLEPLNYIIKDKSESCYMFRDVNGKLYRDQHLNIQSHAAWLEKNLQDKINLDIEKINFAVEQVNSAYVDNIEFFALKLRKVNIGLNYWPNTVLGFSESFKYE